MAMSWNDDINQGTIEGGAKIDRIALRQIFDSERNYLFEAQSNIRDYEWERDEHVEPLFESLLSLEESPVGQKATESLELNMIVLAKMSTNNQKIGGDEFDVYDGQQRIVTLCLLIAAMRDVFIHGWGEDKGGPRVQEIAKAVYPSKADPPDVPRMKIRGRTNDLLLQILSKKDEFGKEVKKLKLPGVRRQRNPPLSHPEKRIIENYEYFYSRLEGIGEERTTAMWTNLKHRTYFLVCKADTQSIARSMVMGLSKGKDLEPIDEFKQIVCYHPRDTREVQEETLVAWNRLVDEVGRDVVEASCLIFAQIYTKRKLLKNQEVRLMQEFFTSFIKGPGEIHRGSDFFRKKIVPAAQALRYFRQGLLVVPARFPSPPSMSFLFQATLIARSKHIELLVMFFLMESGITQEVTGGTTLDEELCKKLAKVERLAVWMLMVKSQPAEKLRRCFDTISDPTAMDLSSEERAAIISSLDVSAIGSKSNATVAKSLLERMNEFELGQNDAKVEMNRQKLQLEHVLPQNPPSTVRAEEESSSPASTPSISHGTSFFHAPRPLATSPPKDPMTSNEVDDEGWTHRLGNLAILNQSANCKMGNKPFSEKREILKDSPYPLTRRIANFPSWDAEAIEKNHKSMLELAREVWKL